MLNTNNSLVPNPSFHKLFCNYTMGAIEKEISIHGVGNAIY